MDEGAAEAFVLRAMDQVRREADINDTAWGLMAELLHVQAQRQQTGRKRVKFSDGRWRTIEVSPAERKRHVYHAPPSGWRWTWFPSGWASDYFWSDSRLTGLWVFTFTRARREYA